jgi:hypothetical protein
MLLGLSLTEQNRLIKKNLAFQRLASQISNLTGDRTSRGFGFHSGTLDHIDELIDEHRQIYFVPQDDATYNILFAKAAQFDEVSESKALNLPQDLDKQTENSDIIINDVKDRELTEQVRSFLAEASHDLKQWNEQAERVLDFSKGRDMMLENKLMRAIEKANHRQEPQGTPFKALDFTPQAQASTPSVSSKGVVTTMVEFTFGIIVFFILASLVASVAKWWNGS